MPASHGASGNLPQVERSTWFWGAALGNASESEVMDKDFCRSHLCIHRGSVLSAGRKADYRSFPASRLTIQQLMILLKEIDRGGLPMEELAGDRLTLRA
jgi:hypothetical protein